MRLRAEVVDFVRLHFLQDTGQVGAIRKIAIVQLEAGIFDVRILIDVIDALGVELRSPALDAMNFITLFQQKFRQVGTVLAGHAGDQCYFLAH